LQEASWRDFLLGLKARGLHGVEIVLADDHAGLRAALREALAEADGLSALLCPILPTTPKRCSALQRGYMVGAKDLGGLN
jgi:prophage DNA circulation protein